MQYGGDLFSGLGLPALFTVCSGRYGQASGCYVVVKE